ncbi:MAG: AzlD domain-containing protein [Hyphomicrobiaceae bacterium]|nr:AzlD domain-containing protein [Hyphomicrobiaceae bacterium]
MSLTFTSIDAWWWPWLFVLLAGWVPNDIWRALGVMSSGRLTEDMEIFRWVKAVATALVAGVIAQLVVLPSGSLAQVPLTVRVIALALGFAAYLNGGRRMAVGVLAGETTLIAGYFAVA